MATRAIRFCGLPVASPSSCHASTISEKVLGHVNEKGKLTSLAEAAAGPLPTTGGPPPGVPSPSVDEEEEKEEEEAAAKKELLPSTGVICCPYVHTGSSGMVAW